tara:strand:- start:641 stop:916 length:276 start_codon:yes stop_codon:yes gene_type:complete
MPRSNDLGVAFDVPALSKAEHVAIKQLSKGEAEPHQQVLALEVIVKKFSRAFDLGYIPGSFDQSAFLSGRGFVGQQVTKAINTPIKEDKNT